MHRRIPTRHRLRWMVDAVLAAVALGAYAALMLGDALVVEASTAGVLPVSLPWAFWVLFAALAVLLCRLVMLAARRSLSPAAMLRRVRGDEATASVEFILTLPIFLIIVAMIVQLALIANAALVLNYAAFAAARAAVTSLPEGREADVGHAAAMALASISPPATGVEAPQRGQDAVAALQRLWPQAGWTTHRDRIDSRLLDRYAYAHHATRWRTDPPPGRFGWVPGARVTPPLPLRAELDYDFRLTVPGAATVLSPAMETVGGVQGRFLTMRGAALLHSSPGRDYTLETGVVDQIFGAAP